MNDADTYVLAETVINSATDKGLTIATAESCTGGWIAKSLTDIPGSSSAFLGGIVAYHNDIKEKLLGVEAETLEVYGAVSSETALEMAKNCAQKFGVDIGVSVTGVAGPAGGSESKPVGLVYFGLSDRNGTRTSKHLFEGTCRESIRRQAVAVALDLINKAVISI
ncbi:MAG: CinA family protein [Hellea sp.]|nr:CinA family protein [Hellea sp.]